MILETNTSQRATKAFVHVTFYDHVLPAPIVIGRGVRNEVRKMGVVLPNQKEDVPSGSPREAESLHRANRSHHGKKRTD